MHYLLIVHFIQLSKKCLAITETTAFQCKVREFSCPKPCFSKYRQVLLSMCHAVGPSYGQNILSGYCCWSIIFDCIVATETMQAAWHQQYQTAGCWRTTFFIDNLIVFATTTTTGAKVERALQPVLRSTPHYASNLTSSCRAKLCRHRLTRSMLLHRQLLVHVNRPNEEATSHPHRSSSS